MRVSSRWPKRPWLLLLALGTASGCGGSVDGQGPVDSSTDNGQGSPPGTDGAIAVEDGGGHVDATGGSDGASSDSGTTSDGDLGHPPDAGADGGGSGHPDASSSGDAESEESGSGGRDAGSEGGALDASPVDANGMDGGTGKDAAADSGCSPPSGGPFSCGPTDVCNGTTSYCFEGSRGDECMPMPPECQCAETRGCACLLANVPNPCGLGVVSCIPRDDGGLLWLQDVDCP